MVWWYKFFSVTIKLLSHYISIDFFYWATRFFFDFDLSTRFLCFLTCLNLVSQPSVTFHLVWEFLFFVIFRIMWMLADISKAKSSLLRILITLVKIWSYLGLNVGKDLHRKDFSWLNKIINIMPEVRPAIVCWGNISVSSFIIAKS